MWWWLERLGWRDAVDILILAYLFYKALLIIQGTRAMPVLKGVVVLIFAAFIARILRLYTIDLILKYVFGLAAVGLLIVFHPELRRALARLGERPWFGSSQAGWQVIEELVRAVVRLSEKRRGALLVVERDVGLDDFVQTGVRIGGRVSADLLESIFAHGEPLHDGAVIIQGEDVAAAGCVLPLAKSHDRRIAPGMRHLAALGISIETDALVVAVSEESGDISIAERGELRAVPDRAILRKELAQLVSGPGRRPWYAGLSWLRPSGRPSRAAQSGETE